MSNTNGLQEPLNVVPETHESAGGANEAAPRFDPNFTKSVIDATGPKATPRMRKVMGSLIQHVHDFLRENEVTVEEWLAGVELMNEAGRMSDDKRNEGQLMCDILGIESLVDEITFKVASDAPDQPTATAILGPFWRKDAPKKQMGETIVHGIDDGDHTFMHGTVTDFATGNPIENAQLDIWHTAPNGLYEQQDENQVDMNLRGVFTTGKDGKYSLYCLRPTSYPIPFDGPAGKLLTMLDRHPMRPAHIHFIVRTTSDSQSNANVSQVSAPGYKPLVTQIFDRRDKHITNDSVFAVKDSLVVDFQPRKGDDKADFELPYDFKLASYEDAKKGGIEGATEMSSA